MSWGGAKGKYYRRNISAGNVAAGLLEILKYKGQPMQIRGRSKGVVHEWAPAAELVQEETEQAQAEQLPTPPETGLEKLATAMRFI
jgi:hypothetical protein